MKSKQPEPRDVVSCGTVTWRYNKDTHVPEILLVRPFERRPNFGIPKGHLELDEDPAECARRETKEEAGITVNIGDVVGTCKTVYGNERKTVIAYWARPEPVNQEPVSLDGENVEVGYYPINNLPPIHVYQRDLILLVADVLRELAI